MVNCATAPIMISLGAAEYNLKVAGFQGETHAEHYDAQKRVDIARLNETYRLWHE